MTISQAANPSDPLGFDMYVGEDLDPSGRDGSGVELVLAAISHRLQAHKILMTAAPDDEVEFGEDVRAWVGEALTQDALDAKAPSIEELLRRDRRIAELTVGMRVARLDEASRARFFVDIHATLISGVTVDRIVAVSDITVEFLAQGR